MICIYLKFLDTSEDETDQSTESENHDQVGDGRRRRKVVKGNISMII
jgi:hypothetical protein